MSFEMYDVPGMAVEGFEVGNVYSKPTDRGVDSKIYYMAINKKTLVTYMNGRFGKFTTKKAGHSSIGISVAELCAKWKIGLEDFNGYMLDYFQPDETAKMRARKEKYEEI
jgi:hypothetical protein